MSREFIESELRRCQALLNPRRTQIDLREAQPEYPPESVGALAGIGLEASDPDVTVSVYVFEDWSRHEEVAQQLARNFEGDEEMLVSHATNGPLLFFGHTRVDDPEDKEAEYRLSGLLSAFAGKE